MKGIHTWLSLMRQIPLCIICDLYKKFDVIENVFTFDYGDGNMSIIFIVDQIFKGIPQLGIFICPQGLRKH